MDSLPSSLYTAAQVRELEHITIQEHGICGYTLMLRAGTAAFKKLKEFWPHAKNVAVMCGGGNNGGDGFVLARLAKESGLLVSVYLLGDPQKIKNEAQEAFEEMQESGLDFQKFILTAHSFVNCDVIVDALLGTGLDRDVSGEFESAIEAMNASQNPILAIDIPSGLNANTGKPMKMAVKANATTTFIGLKQGLFTGLGPDHCGQIFFDDLGVPASVYQKVPVQVVRLEIRPLLSRLKPRKPSANKGDFGHVLIVGGDQGMSGAVRMAAEASLRVGAGLVSVATHPFHAAFLNLNRPEIMSHGIDNAQDLNSLFDRATVIALGVGLGQSEWSQMIFDAALKTDLPMVVDADGLNLLAKQKIIRGNWILTPHPGEAARLLGCTTSEIQENRFKAVHEISQKYHAVTVLKGNGTLVCSADHNTPLGLCDKGNPGMASGGMGDVLTGVIAGLVAQGMSLKEAAQLGVCLHAVAGDEAAIDGQRGMIASDLFLPLRRLVNFSY